MTALARSRLIHWPAPSRTWQPRKGVPREPEGLRDHDCLVVRSSGGTLLDRWIFERHGERRTVDVKTRMVCEDLSWMSEAAAAGAGVLRILDLTLGRYLSSGRLIPALADWEALEAPLIFAAYPRIQRRSKLVRAFVDFLVETFAELETERPPAPGSVVPRVPKPEWFGRTLGRQSAYGSRGRKRAA